MANSSAVLVVDDSPQNTLLLEVIFKKEGFRVLKADNGPNGRRIARIQSSDIILLDV